MPRSSAWIRPKKVRIEPANANAAAFSSWRSMMNTVTAPRMMPASVAPPPSVARPLYKMPVLPSLSNPTAAALVPAAPSAPSIMVLPQAAICGIIPRMIAEPFQHQHHHAGRRGIADPSAHRLPAGMADIDGVDEGIAEQTADQADHAVGRQHLGGRKRVAGRRGALDIVHRLDEIVDAERNRGDQYDSDELEARKDVVHGRYGEREAEVRKSVADAAYAQAAVAKTEKVRSPGDERAGRNGDQAARHVPEVAHAAEPVRQDNGEADHADERRLEHQKAGPHRNEGDGNAGERTEQRRARRDLANDRRDEAARHQDEALDEHPGQSRLPGLDRIVGPEQDRQHHHESDDEHMRHAGARRQGADVRSPGLLSQPIGEPSVIDRAEEQHQPEGWKNSPEHQRIWHLKNKAKE